MSRSLALIYPVMAQILLTLILMLWMGRVRVSALRAKRVQIAQVALSGEAWPDDIKKISNNTHNQFETPILFYVLCGAATLIGATGMLMILLAWTYVATRLVHTAIHVTSNRIQHRFNAFAAGIAVLTAMWLLVAFRLIGAA